MRIGVVFPQTEFGNDPVAIRDYAQAVEELGYAHILAYDHVLGANREVHNQLRGPYSHHDPFHEPFLLFSFMAAVTETLEFSTGIIILPQRQTALVAKQAAELDVLSGGRLRLGVGLGWNWVEYWALGQDYHTRGRRVEEQVKLLQSLWTEPLVNFEGHWDRIPNAGLNPLPVQRPIPVWFGGHVDAVLKRVASMGDGWMPSYRTAAEAEPHLDKLHAYLQEAGRSLKDVGLEPRVHYGNGDCEAWQRTIEDWRKLGSTHLSVNTMGCGFQSPSEHLKAIRAFADCLGLARD